MAPLKQKGDLAEVKVACDLMERGWGVAVPWGENCDFDLIAYRNGDLQRVQVKYTKSDGRIVYVRCRSLSLTGGRIRRIKYYTAETIEWMAVYDQTTDRCYYVPATELGDGKEVLSLRLVPTLNAQRVGVRFADDYLEFGAACPQHALDEP